MPSRPAPRYPTQLLFVVGNASFIGAWAMVLTRPQGWRLLGPLLLAVFLGARVGGMWWYARQSTDDTGAVRRAARFTTVLALLAAALWVVTFARGPS